MPGILMLRIQGVKNDSAVLSAQNLKTAVTGGAVNDAPAQGFRKGSQFVPDIGVKSYAKKKFHPRVRFYY
jgi:hypothetical protein